MGFRTLDPENSKLIDDIIKDCSTNTFLGEKIKPRMSNQFYGGLKFAFKKLIFENKLCIILIRLLLVMVRNCEVPIRLYVLYCLKNKRNRSRIIL